MAYPGDPLSVQPLPAAIGGDSAVRAPSKTAARRWIAIELKRLRDGRETAEVASRIGKLSGAYRHYETGERLPSASDLEVLLNYYGRPERVPFFLEMLKAARKGIDWWIHFPVKVPDWFNLYLGQESAAAQISSFDALWIPGLFQTPEYAEAMFKVIVPAPPTSSGRTNVQARLTDEEIAERVKLRMARQSILTRTEDPPQVRCVLSEAVLRTQVGGTAVMDAQIDQLLELIELPNVEVQILPHASGAHAGVQGTFTILDYPPSFEGDPGTVYVETWGQGLYYEQAHEVELQRTVFERLQEQAEKPEKTKQLIIAARDR